MKIFKFIILKVKNRELIKYLLWKFGIQQFIRHQIFISQDALIEERFTRTSSDEILYQFIVNDDKFYNDVWKGEMLLRKTDGKIYEYACHEGNYAMENILAGARAEEKQ